MDTKAVRYVLPGKFRSDTAGGRYLAYTFPDGKRGRYLPIMLSLALWEKLPVRSAGIFFGLPRRAALGDK